MNTYQELFEKYKNYKLPPVGEKFSHPTEYRSKGPIEYLVVNYEDGGGVVETVHSHNRQKKTLHWIRKMYNKP
jgi:hypothetical protein